MRSLLNDRRRVVGLVGAAILLVADSTVGQQQTFRTGSSLVEVDVIVRDKEGNPVRNLRPEDFTLLDRGKPVDISAFREIARGDLPSPSASEPRLVRVDVASNSTRSADRLVVVVLDDLHVFKGRTDTAREIGRQVVARLGSGASFAVIFTSGAPGVEVTADQYDILAAIDRFEGRKLLPRPYAACDPTLMGANPPPDQGCDLQETYANLQALQAMEHAAALLLGSSERRKAFVYISEGMAKETRGLFVAGLTRSDIIGSADNIVVAPGSQAPTPIHDEAFLDLMESLRRASVLLYPIDPRGEITSQELLRECFPDGMTDDCMGGTPGERGPEAWTNDVRQSQDNLSLVSEASGGFGIVNTDDFVGGIDRILMDLDNFYLLGFSPEDVRTAGYRRLEVRVNRPDVDVRYRRGYDMRPLDDRSGPVRDRMSRMLSSPMTTADVALRMHAVALPRGSDRARIAVAIEITEPRAALEEAGVLRDSIRYHLAAIDLAGTKVVEQDGQELLFALRPRPGAPADAVTYQLLKALELPPGEYQLRAGVESQQLSSGGSVFLNISVPDYDDEGLVLSPMALGYADGSRIPQAPTGRRVSPNFTAPPASQILPFTPTLDREFTSEDVLWLYLEVWRNQPRQEVAIRLAAIDRDERVVAFFDQTLATRDDGRVGMKLPLADLAPGVYRLRVMASDGERLAEREIGIVIRPTGGSAISLLCPSGESGTGSSECTIEN